MVNTMEENKWIRIQDKLPEPYKNVVLAAKNGLGRTIGCWSKNKQEWVIYDSKADFIPYYWLPIPEVPIDDEEENNDTNDNTTMEKENKWEERRYELIKELVLNEAKALMKGSYFEIDYLKRDMDIELRHATQIANIIIEYLKKEENNYE